MLFPIRCDWEDSELYSRELYAVKFDLSLRPQFWLHLSGCQSHVCRADRFTFIDKELNVVRLWRHYGGVGRCTTLSMAMKLNLSEKLRGVASVTSVASAVGTLNFDRTIPV